MDFDSIVPVIGLVLLLCIALPLAWIITRRRWLSRNGGIFDAELNVGDIADPRWVLGIARLSGDDLEWFPILALGMRPARTLSRTGGGIRARTDRSDIEALSTQRVIRLESGGGDEVWELALDSDAVTGLLAWLEAAPPSLGRFSS